MKKTLCATAVLFLSLMIFSCVSTTQEQKPQSSKQESPSPEKEKTNVIAIHNVLPEGDIELLDGFEEGNFWQAASLSRNAQNDRSIEAELSEDWSSEGISSLAMQFNSLSQADSASFFCEGLLDSNWEDAKYFVADMNNTGTRPLTVYIATRGKKSGEWSRTQEVNLGVGQNTNVMFDLANGITDENGSSLPSLAEVNAIGSAYIVVAGKSAAGTLLVDNIRLLR